MASASAQTTERPVEVHSWPATAGDGQIVFLVDAASAIERRLIEGWIEDNRPSDIASERIAILEIPPSRRTRGSRRRIDPRLEAALASGDPIMAPLRVVWRAPLRDGRRSASLLGLLTIGDPRDPGWFRQLWVSRRHPDRWLVVAAEPATASDLRARWSQESGDTSTAIEGLADFVIQKATLALERAERRIRGARYKVPRLVHQEVLGQPALRGMLAELARTGATSEDQSLPSLSNEASRYLREMAATHSPLIIDLVINAIRWLYTRGYDEEIAFDAETLKRVARLEESHPVVFLPTHKSNLDHLVLQYVLHERGLPPNHTAGGINMNFFPVGQLIRRSGVFFIRRTFRDNPVYKAVLGHYIDYLIAKRFPLEWYIEGGRSRSGKLLPPRFGLLANVVDAYRRGMSDDVYLVPVSIAYDQIQDLESYVREQHGGAKQTEGFSWFLGFVRQMKRRYGRIHLAFGEPLSLREQLAPRSSSPGGHSARRFELEKLAFEVSVRINSVTPITPTSLVTLALLGTTGQALTVGETRQALANLLENVRQRSLPSTTELDHLATDPGVHATLEALVENDVVTRFDEGLETVYGIAEEQQLAAAYYRNTVVHFFVAGAIAELALLHAIEGERDQVLPRFWEEVMRLRDLMKYEFFFAEKEAFREEIRAHLALSHRRWEARISDYELDPAEMVRALRPFLSHRVLRPFLESYRVVADRLATVDPSREFDERAFLKDCLGLGRQYALQKRIHAADSVSKVLFQSALKLAANRDLLESDLLARDLAPEERPGDAGSKIVEARRRFASEIRDANRRADIIVALAAGRRAGFAR